ncbi:MAG TPA: CorA family divalent cation transporter, partial [Spirochaetota bacterium]|nr:CorA family divalent cation transporter [Spirochaetota bacterium]
MKTALVSESTEAYFRDLLDHAIQIIDNLELFREMLNGLANLYMSSLSMRLNEIMRVLTIISTIFIPLTFITGVYGMNFKTLPGSGWEYGYWAIWGVMLSVALGMLGWFKHRKWF